MTGLEVPYLQSSSVQNQGDMSTLVPFKALFHVVHRGIARNSRYIMHYPSSNVPCYNIEPYQGIIQYQISRHSNEIL